MNEMDMKSEDSRGRDQSGNNRYLFIEETPIQLVDCSECDGKHWIVKRTYQDKKLSTDKQDVIIETSVLTGCYEYDPFRDRFYQAELPDVSRGIRRN